MIISRSLLRIRPLDSGSGFTIVELLVAIVVFPLVVGSVTVSFSSISHSYTLARQLNEMYAVLSACPELDRAHEFGSLSSATNCYPNNSFPAENGGSATISYTPTLTVTDTTSLANTDPLQAIPDSKVVSISVGFPAPTNAQPLQLRMLITRNGIGQQ